MKPHITPYVEEAKYPLPLLEELKSLNIFEHFLNAPYGKAMSHTGIGAVLAEFA